MSKSTSGKVGKWAHGYVKRLADGRLDYFVRKMIQGRSYCFSTNTDNPAIAQRKYDEWAANPTGYSKHGRGPDRHPLPFTRDLVEEFLEHSKKSDKNEDVWIRKQRHYLYDWQAWFNGRDLRTLEKGDIISELNKQQVGSMNHRRSVIKRLYSWLREMDRIKISEDPCFGQLKNKQILKGARPKFAAGKEQLMKLREHLDGHWKDACTFQMGTGWHTSELVRFVKDGWFDQDEQGDIVFCPQHKSGRAHGTYVSAVVLEAAKKLKARGTFDETKYRKRVKEAARIAGIPQFTPRLFRHSVATFAKRQNASRQAIGEFLGHTNQKTTATYIMTVSAPVPAFL